MINFIVTLISIICILASGLLKNVWAGFIYFALVFSCFITLYWAIVLIIKYINKYRKNIDEDFNFYVATLVNKTNLNITDIENNKAYYLKKFKKSQWTQKCEDIIKICFCLGIFIACFVLFFTI